MVCWSIKKSSNNVHKGKANSMDKILEAIASSEWIRILIGNNYLATALENGLKDASCSALYKNCMVTQRIVILFMKNIARIINGG